MTKAEFDKFKQENESAYAREREAFSAWRAAEEAMKKAHIAYCSAVIDYAATVGIDENCLASTVIYNAKPKPVSVE